MKHLKYAFRVEIDGLTVAKFQKAGPLKMSIAVVEDLEGGCVEASKEYGRVTYDNVTLERGVTDSDELWLFAKDARDGKDPVKDMSIVQTDRAGTEIGRWNLDSCRVAGFEAGDWDGSADEQTIEKMELSIERMDRG
jgi:phage tail-like protein